MKFYTSQYIENLLETIYKNKIKEKNKELKEQDKEFKKQGIIRKYTAKAYIQKPERIFEINNNEISVIIDNNPVKIIDNSGKIYETDTDFEDSINEFLRNTVEYRVVFYTTPCLDYYGQNENVYPARIEKKTGEKLEVCDDEKFDICCG